MAKHKRTKQKKHTMGQQLYKLIKVPQLSQILKPYVKPLYNLAVNIPIFYKNHPEKDFYAHPPTFTSKGISQDPKKKADLYSQDAPVSAKVSYRPEHNNKPKKIVRGGSRGLVMKY